MADRKKRSEVWAHFSDIQSGEPAIRLSECTHCRIKIKKQEGKHHKHVESCGSKAPRKTG